MKLYKNHLKDAATYSRTQNTVLFYFKHMFWAMKFSLTLFVWSVAMLIHSIIPQLVGFTVLERLIEFLKQMQKEHPDDPLLQKIKFDK